MVLFPSRTSVNLLECAPLALNTPNNMTHANIFIAIFCVSLASFAGLAFLSLRESVLKVLLPYLVSFAVGALFANVFLHLLPEMVESSPNIHAEFLLVLIGIIGSFLLERVIHWHHCHNLCCKHNETIGTMMLIGDGLHNITDGILIASSFLVSTEAGIATTIAVILHEIPQEVGDFAIMVHSGWSRKKALLANFASALTALLGGLLVLAASEYIAGIEALLLPLVAGNFLYIAGSDLVPALHKERHIGKSLLQVTTMVAGVVLMYVVVSNGVHTHSHEKTHSDHEEHEMHMEDDHEVH